MSRRGLIVIFLFGLLGAAAGYFLRADVRRRNREVMPEMAYSPASASQSINPVFANGITEQAAPAGTIARGEKPLRFGPTTQEAIRAGEELVNPHKHDDSRAIARGLAIYSNYCGACHGGGGAGDGLVVKRGFPAPPSLLAQHAVDMKDGQIFHIVTFGQNKMPSHATQVSPEDRWNVVSYIRSIQKRAAATQLSTTSATRQNAVSTASFCTPGFQPVSCVLAPDRVSDIFASGFAHAIVCRSTGTTRAGSPCYGAHPKPGGAS
jgi:mono/diheme cytochrome c family protein